MADIGRRAALTLAALAILAFPRSAHAQTEAKPRDGGTQAELDELRKESAQAAAAVRAVQDLEAKLIQLRKELDGMEQQRASWEDVRRRLDDIDARVRALSRQGEPGFASADTPPRPFWDQRQGGGGLVLRSPDGLFMLRPGARLQARYEGALAEPAPIQIQNPDRSTFLLRRVELMLEGHVWSETIEYRIQLDFAEPLILKDAFIQWRMRPTVGLRVGQFKVPFGAQRTMRSSGYEFVDLGEAMVAFALERDLGLMVVGRPLAGRLQYQLGVLNGAGQGRLNDNIDLAYVLRVVAAPLGPLPEWEGDVGRTARPLFSLGGVATFNRLPTDVRLRTASATANEDLDGDGWQDNVDVWQAGAEVRAVWRGAALQAEYFRRWERPPGDVAERRFWGAYAQASAFVLPRFLQVAARAGRTEFPLYGRSSFERVLAGDSGDELTGAITAYLRGHDLKVQLDYSHLVRRGILSPSTQAPDALLVSNSPDTDRLRVQMQLAF